MLRFFDLRRYFNWRRFTLSGKKAGMSEDMRNRYAADWNAYSQDWDRRYGSRYQHLGEEWNDDHTPDRKRDAFYFLAYADRWLRPDMTVLEVGPGGGKWTVQLAARAKHVIVIDVAEEMLKRTKARCESLKLGNVDYMLANGKDFQPIVDESIDFFFSYDVFVHIALEDSWPYTQEVARVLKPSARGACHYAINSVPEAWDRIEQNNDWYRSGRHTLGQYYYFGQEALRRMFERYGLRTLEQHQEGWHCTCVFEKPSESVVPQLELLLGRLLTAQADDERGRAEIVSSLESLPSQLAQSITPLLIRLRNENDFRKRAEYVTQIRRRWRGF